MIDPLTVKVAQDAAAAVALAVQEMQRKAMQAIHRRPTLTRRSFLMSQASDPILALACAPMQSTIPVVRPAPKRRKK